MLDQKEGNKKTTDIDRFIEEHIDKIREFYKNLPPEHPDSVRIEKTLGNSQQTNRTTCM